jgi:hypothetical protein
MNGGCRILSSMSHSLVVTPSDPAFRDRTRLEDLPEYVRADLLAFRDEVAARFPGSDAVGETGALAAPPEFDGVGVVVRPEVLTRPLVVNAVMRFAAPRQLTVHCPEQGIAADPRARIDIDVHRRPTTAGAGISDHAVRGRPHGTLPWITRTLLGGLVQQLEVDGDRLELEVDPTRWFRFERSGDAILLAVSDGPEAPERRLTLDSGGADGAVAAELGWRWARCDASWADDFDWDVTAAA